MSNGMDILRAAQARRTAAVANILATGKVTGQAAAVLQASADEKVRKHQAWLKSDAGRITNLPTWRIEDFPGFDLTDEFRTPNGTMRLRPLQSIALHFMRKQRGFLGPLSVGSGKTVLFLLAAQAMGAKRPLGLIPPQMQIPLRREMDKYREHFRLPEHGKHALNILPYSMLSVAKSTTILEDELQPDLIIADEVHNLKDPTSARTKRLLRYMRAFPETMFVGMSGTVTSRGLRDYGHLAELALRDGSPLPKTERDLIAWANCLDSRAQARNPDWQTFERWCTNITDINDPAERRKVARERFRVRLTTTPGVVATTESSVGTSLYFDTRKVEVPVEVREALRDLHQTMTRPDGEEMRSGLDAWALGMQMSQGFWYRWAWPKGIVDQEWMLARQFWRKAIREYLQTNTPGFDSPFLVTQGVIRGDITSGMMQKAWAGWDKVRGRPQPPTQTVWIHDFLVEDVLRWRQAHPKGLVWYADRAIAQALEVCGERVFRGGQVPPYDGKAMSLSMDAHGTGLNLQENWNENLVISWSTSGKQMEQVIGRTHRAGQFADEVIVATYGHTTDAREAITKSKEDAKYIEQTTGSPQKLLLGTWR